MYDFRFIPDYHWNHNDRKNAEVFESLSYANFYSKPVQLIQE